MENITQYLFPTPTNVSKAGVSNFAETLANDLNFCSGDPIEPLVSNLGGAISYLSAIEEDVPDSIHIEPDRSFVIYLSSMTSFRRDRFTIAHELGHLFLHFPLIQVNHPDYGMKATRWVDNASPEQQRCEWEANWFAASFLMPADEFRTIYNEGSAATQSFFEVSEKAVEVRARSLGLVV